MRVKGILLTLVVLLAALFAAINWGALTALLPVNLLFTTLDLSLGLVLLLVAVGLALTFFILALIDRAGQLHQVSGLERHLNAAQTKLEARRLAEMEALEATLLARLGDLERRLDSPPPARLDADVTAQLGKIEERLEALRRDQEARLDAVLERVTLVRNELAADIAATEAALETHLGRAPTQADAESY
jgi:uncharacterized integral membrane protein